MASTPSERLALRLIGTGDFADTWGAELNSDTLALIDEAVSGVEEISLTGNVALSTTQYVSNQSRNRVLRFTDGGLASEPTITLPATERWYVIHNATGGTYALTFSNGSSTVSVAANITTAIIWQTGSTLYGIDLATGADVATVAPQITNNNLQAVAGQIANNNLQTVAGLDSEITLLGTADAVSDMNTLGHADVVSDMNALAVADVISDMNTLAVPDVINDMNTLASDDIVSDLNTLATPDIVADMNALAVTDVLADMAALAETDVLADMALLADADVIDDMNTLATADIVNDMNLLADADVISDMNTLADADVIDDMNTLATADIVADMNTLAHADVVNDMNTLATADIVNDMNVLGTASNVTDMATLADIQDGTVATNAITIAATNSDNITDYSKTYLGPKNSAPTQRNDGTALQAGDLVFRTDLDQMQVRNAANNAWATVAVTASNFLTVSNNLSDVANATTARTNLGLATVANTGDYSDLSNQPTHLMITGGSAGTIPYQTGANTTAMLAVGVAGQVLSSNGTSAPTWVNQSSGGGGIATQMKFA
tara:strand:+ start:275 stop:1924 length:1650 start_codon:yes stop_codon:yes gene_type:complete